MNTPWLSVAVAEVGVGQYPAGQSNPRITQYHEGTNIRGYDDKASWCSSFVNWCLGEVREHFYPVEAVLGYRCPRIAMRVAGL